MVSSHSPPPYLSQFYEPLSNTSPVFKAEKHLLYLDFSIYKKIHFILLSVLLLFFMLSTSSTSFSKLRERYRKIHISVSLFYILQWHQFFILLSIKKKTLKISL